MKLEQLLGVDITDCACGKMHRIPTREILLQQGALEELPQVVERNFGDGSLLCVLDANTWQVAGQQAVAMLRDRGTTIDVHRVDAHSQPAHADRKVVDEVVAAVKSCGAEGLLAVGSGTINDIGKSAAAAAERPLITVATAASMNGYPSAISALTVEGVKITEPCDPPVAIISDPQVLATAPAQMTGAGFGDLLSKNASTADWVLGHTLHGEYFCAFSAAVAEEAVNRCIENAEAIKNNLTAGLTILSEALMRSGISMVVAGSSAPASGGEHLISHLWDMTAHWSGRVPALHGAQTGVTTLICLKLYEKLLALDASAVHGLAEQAPVDEQPDVFEQRMRNTFGDIADAVLPLARQKYRNGPALQQCRQRIFDRWEDIRQAVAPVVIPADTSRKHLQAAGAVYRAADLGVSAEELEFAYRNARWIRNRYTVLDLAAELGVLEDWQDEVLGSVQIP